MSCSCDSHRRSSFSDRFHRIVTQKVTKQSAITVPPFKQLVKDAEACTAYCRCRAASSNCMYSSGAKPLALCDVALGRAEQTASSTINYRSSLPCRRQEDYTQEDFLSRLASISKSSKKENFMSANESYENSYRNSFRKVACKLSSARGYECLPCGYVCKGFSMLPLLVLGSTKAELAVRKVISPLTFHLRKTSGASLAETFIRRGRF